LTGELLLGHLACFVVVAQERTLARAAQRLHLSHRRRADQKRHAARARLAAPAAAGARRRPRPPPPWPRCPRWRAVPLAQAIARLLRRRPHAGISVRTASNPELLAARRAGEADFAVGRIAEPAMMRGVSFELLYAESLAIVARPRHPLAGQTLSPRALLDYPLVIPGAGTAPRHDAGAFFEAHGIALPPGCTQTQPVSAARALTLLSDAVWITPQHAVQRDIDSGWLCRLSVPVPGGAEPAGLPRRSEAIRSDLAEQLMDILRELA
jgi:DNA-binding transcriptional LysR family regulator